jgi:hypothetical protein
VTVYDWLFRSDLANILQVIGSLSLIAAIVAFFRKLRCAQPGCYRAGLHRVTGTTYRTCVRHTTLDVHDALYDRHARERPAQHELLN